MISTFLELVNKVNRRVNEVELTSTNFGSAVGFYSTAKDAVNDAIRRVNQDQFQWPFNHSTKDEVLVAGNVRYSFPLDAKAIDFDSFRIQRDATFGNSTVHLKLKDYDEYLKKYIDVEYNTSNTSIRQLPKLVFQAQALDFIVYPAPDYAYTLTYEYYISPTDLSAHDDKPTLPNQFDHAIINGAMWYVYNFRGEMETARDFSQQFKESVNALRTIYINRQPEVSDTRLIRSVPTRYIGS